VVNTVEYKPNDEFEIPLQVKAMLGHSATAMVESVLCRRILLARKTIKCNRRLTKEDLVVEVEHLQRLQHSHIVRFVGTYTLRKSLSILLYPVADQDLEEFIEDMSDMTPEHYQDAVKGLRTFFGCLSHAIEFIHWMNIKHMDIKPKNILVRRNNDQLKVYIADFGIAKAYKSAAEAFTDGPTPFTRKYAAPEVIMQDVRGYPADIFSLGCVFMEMLVTMGSSLTLDLRASLAEMRGPEFHTHAEMVVAWYLDICAPKINKFEHSGRLMEVLPAMLDRSPYERPISSELKKATAGLCCRNCNNGPEPFEAASVAVE
jgi:serine/threonine protein kinase